MDMYDENGLLFTVLRITNVYVITSIVNNSGQFYSV